MTQLNLHKIEKKILLSLVNDDNIEIEKLATLTNLSLDNVRRGIEWLKYKGMVSISIQKESILELTSQSQNKNPNEKNQPADFITLPERRIINEIKKTDQKSIKIGEFVNQYRMSNSEFGVGIKNAIRNGWLTKESDSLKITNNSEILSFEEILLQQLSKLKRIKMAELSEDELRGFTLLKNRPGYIKE
ncbi:MAG: hypothetical protein QOK91_07855, partial [Nitrososphaeraceae archaeon]|nr:hypothetical protein [Nitrososphaeraceae archaeon]